jgi:hypothetical protein
VPTIVPSGILTCSQEPFAGPYLDPVKSHPDPHTPSPSLPRCFNFVCSVLTTEVLYAFLVLPARAACSACAFFLHFTCIINICLRRSFIIHSLLKTLNLLRNISRILHFLKSLLHCFLCNFPSPCVTFCLMFRSTQHFAPRCRQSEFIFLH